MNDVDVKVELVSMFMWLNSMFSMFYYVINIKSSQLHANAYCIFGCNRCLIEISPDFCISPPRLDCSDYPVQEVQPYIPALCPSQPKIISLQQHLFSQPVVKITF